MSKTIKLFEVRVPATTIYRYVVMAEDAEDAKQKVLAGDAGFEGYAERDEDLDSNNWTVERRSL